MGLFDKKYCDLCGEKIGLFGNRKLEDGNCCHNCAKKLSPWFSQRRHSTVEEIRQQLTYREENKNRAARFQTTRELGRAWRILFDENHHWIAVTCDKDLVRENTDILEYAQLTGCRLDVDEHRTELKRAGKDGKQASYEPPRYEYNYNFDITVTVNCPYFDEMHFRLNPRPVTIMAEEPRGFSLVRSFDPSYNMEYRQYRQLAEEICAAVEQARISGHASPDVPEVPQAQSAPAAASGPWTCSACGSSNTGKFCEYCGTPRP